jgi:aspartate kinase
MKKEIHIHKFGGSSTKDIESIERVVEIIRKNRDADQKQLIVFSAMGKTTRELDKLHGSMYSFDRSKHEILTSVREKHESVLRKLVPQTYTKKSENIYTIMRNDFMKDTVDAKSKFTLTKRAASFNIHKDEIMAYGELLTSSMMSVVMDIAGIRNVFLDARNIVMTDTEYGRASCDEVKTKSLLLETAAQSFEAGADVIIIQGHIGSGMRVRMQDGAEFQERVTTTMGFDSSDYSAALFGKLLGSPSVTLWKDVPGLCRGNPENPKAKFFKKLDPLKAAEFLLKMSKKSGIPLHMRAIDCLCQAEHPMSLNLRSHLDSDLPGTEIFSPRVEMMEKILEVSEEK